ncbi:hypothetical protein K0M31_013893 [Melipona bicolor]|uniref:Uncharacterized protein n=1 Tax=Melipona bicolor TaxID=60889 RepID=A0AA40KTM4_9HYME|nr:hypothetical protein K0M31_013893 [Melipona bicolor]
MTRLISENSPNWNIVQLAFNMNINARQTLSERQNRDVLLMPAKCTQFNKSKVYKQESRSNSCITVTVQPPASVMVTATCQDIQASV